MSRLASSGPRHQARCNVRAIWSLFESWQRSCLAVLICLLMLGLARSAQAAPLTAQGLDLLQQYVDCQERCDLGRAATRTTCKTTCGVAPAAWNKDLDVVAGSRHDYQLALLEFFDAGLLTKICYESGAVVPKGRCGGGNCLANHTAAECTDADNDGLKAWQETLAGTSSSVAQRTCTSGDGCNGFAEQCYYEPLLDSSYCKARATTTAFSLQLVEENATEIVVNLSLDYSPVPPTILDVYVQFDGATLTLTDSRALYAATSNGKRVEVRQVADNLLRVIALGADDARVIEPGPVAELVFRRKQPAATTVGFSTQVEHRQKAMAPSLGAQQVALSSDSAWGAPINLKSASDVSQGHLLLHYDFESDRKPLAFSAAKDAGTTCDSMRIASGQSTLNGNCPVEPTVPAAGPSDPGYAALKLTRDRWINQLTALQAGTTMTTRLMPGVAGLASWLDGRNDHIELPLTFNPPKTGTVFKAADQSFSASFWLMADGAPGEQILFGHAAQVSELTQYALLSRPTPAAPTTFDLVWLDGSIGDAAAVRTVVTTGLPIRQWTHVGVSVDATAATAAVYLNGVLQRTLPLAAASLVSCPQIDATANTRLTLHQEGDFAAVRGTGPENIYLGATGGNGLDGVEVVDSNGLGRRALVRLLDASASQPDYNPYVDRLVFASNSGGNSEIWLANGDGTGLRRLTSGFGSTEDGVFARRPRWAPDGSGIVFESNARSVEHLDNLESLGYQLYYLGYNPQQNAVSIQGPNGSTLQELDYEERVAAGDIANYRLTRATDPTSHSNAQWLSGRQGTGDLALGELAFTASDANGDNPRGRRVRVALSFGLGSDAAKQIAPLFANEALLTNRSLLAARAVRAVGQPVVERALLAEQKNEQVATTEFSTVVTTGGTCSTGSSYQASIRFTNSAQIASCWDTNRNQACDTNTEDLNKDGSCTVLDCNPIGFEGLFAQYNSTVVKPNMAAATAGSFLVTNNKNFRATQVFGATEAVRLEVTSPINSLPIPNGTEVAKIQFCGSGPPVLTFKRQKISQAFTLLTNDGTTVTPTSFASNDSRVQNISAAEFSPDGKRLALAVIFDARPMLLRTSNLLGTAGSDLLSTEPTRIDGLSWAGAERIFPCNWVGAVRNPTTKLYQGAFRGALDEIKLLDYARSEAAYSSEAARGSERLHQAGTDGQQPSPGSSCSADADCEAHQLCQTGACVTVTCTPGNAYPCARGRCQKLPVEASSSEVFACVAECASDSTCGEQQCANGPCRFCDSTARTCSECRKVVENVGGLTLQYVQGCPDRNSFACDRGSCVSDCYSFKNGESKYLCDPATEYCRAGKCTLFDWNWADLSPMSMTGGGEMQSDRLKYTSAVPQLYPIKIKALGVADHAHPPELLVEGKVTGVAGDAWFDIGRIIVDNETRAEADNKPYVLLSPYPITRLRLRTILPPYENLTNSAMGLTNQRSGEFCSPPTSPACRFQAQGSRAMLGYEAWIPGFLGKCKTSPGSCDVEQLKYMRPGTPIALVLDVEIKDKVQPKTGWVNLACPYWNGSAVVPDPVTGTGLPNLLIYGNAAKELSNQKTRYYPTLAATSLQTIDVVQKGFGVLNCNFIDDTGSVASVAAVEMVVNSNVTYPGSLPGPIEDGKIRETGNGCTVDVSSTTTPRYEACFEWGDNQVSLDPFASEPQAYRTLTFENFSSFGWGNNPPPDDAP